MLPWFMGPPFERLAFCSLLSWKVWLLVALTARRVSEMRVVTSEPSYTVFHKDKVQLCLHLTFLPKVVSQFLTGHDIFLPFFFPKPQVGGGVQIAYSGRQEGTSLLHSKDQAIS